MTVLTIWLLVLAVALVAVAAVLVTAEAAIGRVSRSSAEEMARSGKRGSANLNVVPQDRGAQAGGELDVGQGSGLLVDHAPVLAAGRERVDGLVLQLRDGEPPRVAYLESGGRAPWRRLGRRMSGWVAAIQKRLPGGDEPTRIPWAAVLRVEANIEVSLDATRTPEMALELWLREHVIAHMPWT